VGEHPYLDAGELAVEKLTGTSTRHDTGSMRRGRHLEAAVATWWEEEHGLALIEPEVLYLYDDTLIATLDRLVVGTRVAVEIKTTNRFTAHPARSWYWQAQAQVLCADLEAVELVVLDPTMELKCFTIEPDAEDQALLLEAATKFLHAIRAGELPPEIELSYRAASTLHHDVERDAIELDDEAACWCRSLGALQARIHELQADEDKLKGMIGHRLGEAAEGRHEGRTLVTWRSTTRGGIDAKRLRAEHPDLAREYATTTTYRTLRLKEHP
jgi:predicted phage-related endonuclease